ncbi:hypothetical protein TCAL_15255 [Tigriopus californicus]|uniref:Uncharacterized protein n=1 Tax=Tigriopus californicus TaxID=6832 RepID=A0A553NC31_TIGCA|nr:hypothetical protein TCAL_15255 [Tigriopus californicus]
MSAAAKDLAIFFARAVPVAEYSPNVHFRAPCGSLTSTGVALVRLSCEPAGTKALTGKRGGGGAGGSRVGPRQEEGSWDRGPDVPRGRIEGGLTRWVGYRGVLLGGGMAAPKPCTPLAKSLE